jgi:hypothetical protein
MLEGAVEALCLRVQSKLHARGCDRSFMLEGAVEASCSRVRSKLHA